MVYKCHVFAGLFFLLFEHKNSDSSIVDVPDKFRFVTKYNILDGPVLIHREVRIQRRKKN